MSIIQIQQLLSIAAALAYCLPGLPGLPWRLPGNRWVVIAALFHTAALGLQFTAMPYFQLGSVLSVFMLLTLLISWHSLEFPSIRRLLLVMTAAAVWAPLLLAGSSPGAFSLHGVLALAVYALAAAAFLLCLDLRLTEGRLRRQPQPVGGRPLLARENQYFNYVLLSFVLLTLTLLSGIAAGLNSAAGPFQFTHKQLFAYLTWLVFLVLLLGRRLAGWRGRAAQNWFLAGYLFLLLSYIGSTFVAQIILQKP